MTIELFEILNEAGIDSLVTQCLENAGIRENNRKYDDYSDALRGILSSINFDLPDTKEELNDYI